MSLHILTRSAHKGLNRDTQGTGFFRDYIGVRKGLYREYIYRENGKEHGNSHSILGSHFPRAQGGFREFAVSLSI